jgi:hypothetical protein
MIELREGEGEGKLCGGDMCGVKLFIHVFLDILSYQ